MPVDHFKLCFWQLGTNAGYVSQTAEAALWSDNHLELSAFFQSGSLFVLLLWVFHSVFLLYCQIRWVTRAGFCFPPSLPWFLWIIIKHCCVHASFWCQLGRENSRAKLLFLQLTSRNRANNKLGTVMSEVKWWQDSWVRFFIISYNWKMPLSHNGFVSCLLSLAIATLQTTKQWRSRPLNLIAEATPLMPHTWLKHQPSDII